MNEPRFACVAFNKRSGKIFKSLEAKFGSATLRLWALQNTPKSRDTIIFDLNSGDVVAYYEGTEDFPKVYEKDLGNIEQYCAGLLRVMQRA